MRYRDDNTRQAGFTLIELMVVMVIVGLLVGMVSLVATGNRDKRELENEARRLMAILQMAADEAVLQNVEIGVQFDDDGYRFMGFDEENLAWIELPQTFLAPSRLPEHIQLDISELGSGFALQERRDDDFEFGSGRGSGTAAAENEGKGDEKNENATPFVPQVLLLASGENTPFNLQIQSLVEDNLRYTIRSDGFNPPELQLPEEE